MAAQEDELAKLREAAWPYTIDQLQRLLADGITYKAPMKDIEMVLSSGGSVNIPVKKGLCPLHYAAYVDYTECVQYLIDRGADVNVADEIGHTPLHICARRGLVDTMEILISNNAKINFQSDNQAESDEWVEPLNMAIESNSPDCVRLLLENGARPNNKYFLGHEINMVPLDNVECLSLILKYGADPNTFSRNGMNPLMKACRDRKLKAARILVEHGADLNLQCPSRFEQKTALHFAIGSKSVATVHSLLRHGSTTQRPDGYKYSALHEAVLVDSRALCQLLLEWNAHVDELTSDKSTPLMLACATSRLTERKDIIEVLLEHGADVNAHSMDITYVAPSSTPLIEYLKNVGENVDFDVVLLLVKYGARLTFDVDIVGYKVFEPFGVLNYIPDICHRSEVMGLLTEAAEKFNVQAIQTCQRLETCYKKLLLRIGVLPRDLKHILRLHVRRNYRTNLPENVDRLPLPPILKQYLLFEVPFTSAWQFRYYY
ncbi:hypothetical protein ScPMuIL_010209 [Solemya velum]